MMTELYVLSRSVCTGWVGSNTSVLISWMLFELHLEKVCLEDLFRERMFMSSTGLH